MTIIETDVSQGCLVISSSLVRWPRMENLRGKVAHYMYGHELFNKKILTATRS